MCRVFAKIGLQMIACYITGRTAPFATTHRYYKLHTEVYKTPCTSDHMVCAGALFYVVDDARRDFKMFWFSDLWDLFKKQAEDPILQECRASRPSSLGSISGLSCRFNCRFSSQFCNSCLIIHFLLKAKSCYSKDLCIFLEHQIIDNKSLFLWSECGREKT